MPNKIELDLTYSTLKLPLIYCFTLIILFRYEGIKILILVLTLV